ncbi:hypothetical protein QE152_g12616 [Popillia japonica]|uniref:Uncharacterized protein n=1 Tax=Popillia japonica TaxID=7064 RepID=A0AAW1LR86_POPJA
MSGGLVKKIITCLRIEIHECFFWCDSTIVLSWLQTNPLNLKPFVANRVVEIQDLTRKSKWLHVGTRDNPADLISRGVSSSKLHGKWWSGPDWLSMPNDEWVLSPYHETMLEIPEMKTTFIATSMCKYTQNALQRGFYDFLTIVKENYTSVEV